MTSEVATTLWASNMDLFALTTFDNLVQLYRINIKAQKVFQVEEEKNIKGLAFSPDCIYSLIQLICSLMDSATVRLNCLKLKMDRKSSPCKVRIWEIFKL